VTWRRSDIELGDRFAKDDGSTIWEVVAIADEPTVYLRPVRTGPGAVGGLGELHYVINSPLFAEWSKVRLEGPDVHDSR
jgi:hypothetical protein